MPVDQTAEQGRLEESRDGKVAWKKWGPYLSERAWGTVREDYSAAGAAWDYFPHDHARSRAYRWNEDGLAGISDDRQFLCFALALWNGHDPILKERLFGLTGPEGNHGEDVKEYYFYLDATPTHSYLKMLYKYPQSAFPYADLARENRRRGKGEAEYELLDTGVFAEDRYFDIFIEYAKAGPEDILVRITAANRGPDQAELHLLPTLWFRNTWSWGDQDQPGEKPRLSRLDGETAGIQADHPVLGRYLLAADGEPELLFAENETNFAALYGAGRSSPWVKDGINDYVVAGRRDAINPAATGTKASAHYRLSIEPGASATVRLRLTGLPGAGRNDPGAQPAHFPAVPAAFADFDPIFARRQQEADAFYAALQPASLEREQRMVQRQALAGMLWSKQFYAYDVARWLQGDPAQPPPPVERRLGRNRDWEHFNTEAVLSMPDKWEYPWFAAWDLAFHCVALALVDLDFAKDQLLTLGMPWYQHPNGQIPAYEWAFGDVNPPVLAWAALRLYEIEQESQGTGDRDFLERVFHKQMLNFTWWVNRKDADGRNVFQGGFLGLDNIGLFDRSAELPVGGHLEQSDGTAWMGMFCLNMLSIALELARQDRVYEDIATKFFEHFLYLAGAMHNVAGEGITLWDEEDEFFYDVLHTPDDGGMQRLRVRSMVGLIPLFAVCAVDPALLDGLPDFGRHMQWFLDHRPSLAGLISRWYEPGVGERRLLALLRGHRMKRVLRRMLDESEFLSPFGIRSLSRGHLEHPYALELGGVRYEVSYQPAESSTGLFGGNSNWRGPVWFPVNYLIIHSLQGFYRYYGDDFKIECPTGSGLYLNLNEIAGELSQRLIRLFLPDADGRRPVFGGQEIAQRDAHWRDCLLFHEYFHGDSGAGLGAGHQTGWTGLVADLIQQQGSAQDRRAGSAG